LDSPDSLRIDRHPNLHLGFGIGEHFCLGAHLARQTGGALPRNLLTRLESIELAGPREGTASKLVPGLKHRPIRYRIQAPRAGVAEEEASCHVSF
jgi:cytochrome P450